MIAGGLFAGLAGASLAMEATNSFQAGMTAGRGFIALAAMIVGRWTPVGSLLAALLFSSFLAIGQALSFAPPSGELGDVLSALPSQLYDALPYIVTIIVLAGVVGRSSRRLPTGSRTSARRRPEAPAMTADERARARAILDLQEGRGPVAHARRRGHRGNARERPAGSRSSARRPIPDAPRTG